MAEEDLLQKIWQKLHENQDVLGGVVDAALAYDAAQFAETAHHGQTRSGGKPYVTHVWRVMLAAIDDFLREPRIVRYVSHHYEDEPEEEYLALVAAGGLKAVRLKRLDKLDNLRDLANASSDFRMQKLLELPIFLALWREIDPEGAEIIRKTAEIMKRERLCPLIIL